MARRTHKMIGANDNVRGNGVPTQANSITAPSIKVFVPCEDTVPATELTDIINSTDFITAALSCGGACTLTAGQDAYSIRTGSAPPDNQVAGNPATWIGPVGNDWLYFAVIAPTDEDDSRAVYIEQSIAASTSIRAFPYRCNFRYVDGIAYEARCKDLSGNYTLSTLNVWQCDYCEGFNFEAGEIHTIGIARRGDWLEHYVDNRLVGKIDVVEYANSIGVPAMATAWDNFDGGDGIELTHSAYSGGGCSVANGVGHARADWYGVTQHVFSDGLPSRESIEAGMLRMKDEWSNGNKINNPEWITL